MSIKHLFYKSLLFVGLLCFLFASCVSKTKKPITTSSFDSCSIAKPFENIGLAQAGQNSNYTGVLNNYWGDDTTKLDFQHYFENGQLIKSIFYYENGKVEEEYFYKCGALNGLQKFYYNNGKLGKVLPYSYGYRHGIGEEYNENGILIEKIFFERDSIVKDVHFFDKNSDTSKNY